MRPSAPIEAAGEARAVTEAELAAAVREATRAAEQQAAEQAAKQLAEAGEREARLASEAEASSGDIGRCRQIWADIGG